MVRFELAFVGAAYRPLEHICRAVLLRLIITHASINAYAVAPVARRFGARTAVVVHAPTTDRLGHGEPLRTRATRLYQHGNRYALTRLNFETGVSDFIS